MSDLTPSWGGRRLGAGRKPGDIGMADRIKRYAVAEKAARYADGNHCFYAQVFVTKGKTRWSVWLGQVAIGGRVWETGAARRQNAQPAPSGCSTFVGCRRGLTIIPSALILLPGE